MQNMQSRGPPGLELRTTVKFNCCFLLPFIKKRVSQFLKKKHKKKEKTGVMADENSALHHRNK